MGTCSSLSKALIFFVNFLFWLLAGGLIFISVFSLTQYYSTTCEFANFYLFLPLSVITVIGFLLFINSFVGCCGAVRESKCCLSVFFILTFTVLCLEVSAAVLAFMFQESITEHITTDWKSALDDYTPSSDCNEFLDLVQSNLTCCGCDDYNDWSLETTEWSKNHEGYLPWSCCDESDRILVDNLTVCDVDVPQQPNGSNVTTTLSPPPHYNKGCCSKLTDLTETNVLYFAVGGITIAVLQAIVILIACSLMCRRREQSYIHLDADFSQPSTPSFSNI